MPAFGSEVPPFPTLIWPPEAGAPPEPFGIEVVDPPKALPAEEIPAIPASAFAPPLAVIVPASPPREAPPNAIAPPVPEARPPLAICGSKRSASPQARGQARARTSAPKGLLMVAIGSLAMQCEGPAGAEPWPEDVPEFGHGFVPLSHEFD